MSAGYALSLKQPWASLLISGGKTIEVRSWSTRIRGKIYIHAARVPDARPEAWKWVTDDIRDLSRIGGGIIGSARLSDCVAYKDVASFEVDSNSHLNELSWFQPKGMFGFVFCNPISLHFRECPGNVRFFRVEVAA